MYDTVLHNVTYQYKQVRRVGKVSAALLWEEVGNGKLNCLILPATKDELNFRNSCLAS